MCRRWSGTGEFVKTITIRRVERRSSKLELFRFDAPVNNACLEFRLVNSSFAEKMHDYFANVAAEFNFATTVLVTSADMTLLYSQFKQTYLAEADLNRDGLVDANDLTILQGRISTTVRLVFPTFKAGSL